MRQAFYGLASLLPANASPETQVNASFGLGLLTWFSHMLQDASPTASSIAAICAAIIGVVGVVRMVLGWFSGRHTIALPPEVKVEEKRTIKLEAKDGSNGGV